MPLKDESKLMFARVHIPLYYKIKKLAEKEGRTDASIIRQALREFIEKREVETDTPV